MRTENEAFVVVCDNIRSIHNVGSIFRTSDALGVDKIYLAGITPTPKNEKLAKTALGAEKTVKWEHGWQTWRIIDRLNKEGFVIVGLELTKQSIRLDKLKPKFPLALVLGNEVEGISSALLERCDHVIEIPMKGSKESLNVSVSFGIAVWEISKYRK